MEMLVPSTRTPKCFSQWFLVLMWSICAAEFVGVGGVNGTLEGGGALALVEDGKMELYGAKRKQDERHLATQKLDEEIARSIAVLTDFNRSAKSTTGSMADWKYRPSGGMSGEPYYCNWTGITCRAEGQVVELNLSNQSLNGTITRMLANLTSLETLDLSFNQLTGRIPSELPTELTSLTLASNNLDGEIPQSLSKLRRLRSLDLNTNQLRGEIPALLSNCTALSWLILSDNSLSGHLPSSLGQLASLGGLVLFQNNFHGPIPSAFGNLSQLLQLDLSANHLTQSIPSQLGSISFQSPFPYYLYNGYLILDNNQLNGLIPPSLGNCSGVRNLNLQNNDLTSNIPAELGALPNLVNLSLANNQLEGNIPVTLGNLSRLQLLYLNENNLTGSIPESLALLPNLNNLSLGSNQLQGSIPSRISSPLENLYLSSNFLSGVLPLSLANCTTLVSLYLSSNLLQGRIPPSLGNLKNVQLIDLHQNHFEASIPPELASCTRLFELNLGTNNLNGSIPTSLGNLAQSLRNLNLARNELEGPIPSSLGNYLLHIDLSYNHLSGSIPDSIANLQTLNLNLSHNSLTGPIPQGVRALVDVQNIDISTNELDGEIPDAFRYCISLRTLNLSFNNLSGTIPRALGKLNTLSQLDLSVNKLSGPIPLDLTDLQELRFLNVSQNQLEGEIPTTGVFGKFMASSFLDNPELCGRPLSRDCPGPGRFTGSATAAIVCSIVGAALLICFLVIWRYKARCLSSTKNSTTYQDLLKAIAKVGVTRISSKELHDATNGYDESNLLGMGGSSKVYKGELRNGRVVAVKLLNLDENDKEIERIFKKECEILGQIRHRNLVHVLSTCCNLDMKAIVLEYMPNGSLQKHLFGGDVFDLDWNKIFDIAVDVANALVYLHYDYGVPIIHSDLKPSNILLDKDFNAHVADFGISKLLSPNGDASSTSHFRGSIGYIAPECAELSHQTTKGDVYSYGVVLLSMLTRRQPISDLFDHGIDLSMWVKMFLPDMFLEAIDPTLREQVKATKCEADVLLVLKVALMCTNPNPFDRPTSKDVKEMLLQIRDH